MNTKDIIKEKYKVARKYYETNKHTTECSYYMGYMDALGELLEKIEQEEEKKIPEKINTIGSKWYSEYIKSYIDEEDKYSCYDELLMNKINEIIDYLKSKGE